MTAGIVRFPPRRSAAIFVVRDDDGWLALAGEHAWSFVRLPNRSIARGGMACGQFRPTDPRGASMISALTEQFGGSWHGSYGTCRCPAHDDASPSLSIRDGKRGPLLKCHAGCEGRDVARALGLRPGRWYAGGPWATATTRNAAPARPAAFEGSHAEGIWRSGRAIAGTLGERYLRARAITIAPDRLRFHPWLKHHPSGRCWPALIALVTTGIDDEPTGVHRTYLAKHGETKASAKPAKMMLGTCAGGAVRLAPAAASLLIGEGIETTLSAMQVTGRAGWAALSTAGLKALRLPEVVREITILVDGDKAGDGAAKVAAARWFTECRRVRLARAPHGQDFNDLLIAERAP
jgi:putative DNA primase/helicase